jgi:hypothetical protein
LGADGGNAAEGAGIEDKAVAVEAEIVGAEADSAWTALIDAG